MTAYHRQKEIQRFYAEDHPYVLRISELEQRIADLERQLAEATTWRSPETAPRDTYFLALMYGSQPCVMARNAANTAWICLYSAITFDDEDGPHFTGWLPLPPLPEKKEDV